MKNLPLLVGTIVGTLLLTFIVAMAFSRSSQTELAEVDLQSVTENARLVKGAESPKVTIVEFADFQCPACAGYAPVAESIVEANPDEVQLIFRHYPLTNIHPLALTASYAAEAALEQNKFWEMHDLLFANQDEWSELSLGEFKTKIGEYAEQLEIDKTQLLERIESPEVKEAVAADMALGNQVRIQFTPTFIVNGTYTPAPELQSTVEFLLADSAE